MRLFGSVNSVLIVCASDSTYGHFSSGNVHARASAHVCHFSGDICTRASAKICAHASMNTHVCASVNAHPRGGFFECPFVILSNMVETLDEYMLLWEFTRNILGISFHQWFVVTRAGHERIR